MAGCARRPWTRPASLASAKTLQKASQNGIQIMGGFGMLEKADRERYFREGMQATVGGGTSQIIRTIIALSMKL
ncbi:MAG: acyl-CoA dehydrogenase family protein [Alphaproteobacteria bacterium]